MNERSLFANEQKVDNGRLPVEAEAYQSWPPTKKNFLINKIKINTKNIIQLLLHHHSTDHKELAR